jgi:hypothetical protein
MLDLAQFGGRFGGRGWRCLIAFDGTVFMM